MGLQHHDAFARHGAHQAEGLQHNHRFTQAGSADAQLLGQLALAGQHVTRAPLAPGEGGAEFLHHGIDDGR
ncbi:hypothetical protein D3C75_1360320 [compost metagenome]